MSVPVKRVVSVPKWLVLGSFPVTVRKTNKMLEDGFPCEPSFAPSKGEVFDGRVWTQFNVATVNFHDSSLNFDLREWCYAYAFTYIRSERRQDVRLLVRSDDGVAILLNGKEVLRKDCRRMHDTEQDIVPVTLRKGWNSVLCKVSQVDGHWSMEVALAGKTETCKAPRVSFSLRRPSAKAFPGLTGRKNGVIAAGRRPAIDVTPTKTDLVFSVKIPLFNDSDEKATSVKLTVAETKGKVLASKSLSHLNPFGSTVAELKIPATSLLKGLKNAGSVMISVQSSLGENLIQVPDDIATRIFLLVMTGFELPLASEGTMEVPPMFQGKPAVVEALNEREQLFREVPWPVMPRLEVSASMTGRGKMSVGLQVPSPVTSGKTLVTFGGPETHALIHKVRFLLRELNADASACNAAAIKGIESLAELDGAEQCMLRGLGPIDGNHYLLEHRIDLLGHRYQRLNIDWGTERSGIRTT